MRSFMTAGSRGHGIGVKKTVRPSSGHFKESKPKKFYPRSKTDRADKPPKVWKDQPKVDYHKTGQYRANQAGVLCRHCNTRKVNRPRGLCWTCYYTPGVTALYPTTSKYARRGVGNFTGEAPLPPIPTFTDPGTPEKLGVMAERAFMKQSLFHPADARFAGDQLPLEWLREHSPGFVNEGCAA